MTGLVYGIPMPVQPLKAMAVLMISQKLSGNLMYGAGLMIGIIMLILTSTNLLKLIVKYIPKSVVRGIQFGLGLSLAKLALGDYIMSDGLTGYLLAGVGFVITIILIGNRKYPPALFVVLTGVLVASFTTVDFSELFTGFGLGIPKFNIPGKSDMIDGFLLLAIPQIALSISNSIIATKRTVGDLFPEKNISVNKIGLTYSFMNIVNPFFSGIPTCHGAGGIAGHYGFGGRTGGSVIIYGSLFLIIGLFFSSCFSEFVKFFPHAILGIILLFEALTLMTFIMDVTPSKKCLYVAFVVALIAFLLPYGYAIGLVTGIILDALIKKDGALKHL
jgi:MFS superfamily sulfate permease-like transporter